ncbi:ATP-grasp domain-containing protein [Streptomyces chartreusis]|uniref:ATP-grasp domain-containing protein n=1 Tax=Streptomyces chartreusis TaxID=1969 RepID=UPI002E16E262|nr:ATP-grasp domain-containing protein [Streptomyces chartreusis]
MAERAPLHGMEILAHRMPQQDQALFWEPGQPKMLLTSYPVAEMEWLRQRTSLPPVANLSPTYESGSLFADLLADERVLAHLVAYIGSRRSFRLVPRTTTNDLWSFVDAMWKRFGIVAHLPESSGNQAWRDCLDTKSGLRALISQAQRHHASCRVPRGVSCRGPNQALAEATKFLSQGIACIVKPDQGEAGAGMLIFRPDERPVDIARRLSRSAFFGNDRIVVEEYISGAATAYPSLEFVVPPDRTASPRLTLVCDAFFRDSIHPRGGVSSPDLVHQPWYGPFVTAGRALAHELQQRGYRGYFGLDAVVQRRDVYLVDLNPRRTAFTHLHDYAVHSYGPEDAHRQTVGNYDFYNLPEGMDLTAILKRLGPLVRSPQVSTHGVLPFELTGLEVGRLSCLVHARCLAEYYELIGLIGHLLERG